jgi:hypothetical protein
MKRPSISLDKDAALDFLLRHAEKIVLTVSGLAALWLAWGGIDALRTMSVTTAERPESIVRAAGEAASHIEREKTLPAEQKWAAPPLAKAIDPWREPAVAEPPKLALLDSPLFEEFAKRTQPDVLPIEDLQAVAGLAVITTREPVAAPDGGPKADERPRPRGRKEKTKDGKAAPPASNPLVDAPAGQPPAAAPIHVRIAPYVMVSGLIPVAKQAAEYRRRFASVGFQDPKRDTPIWGDWILERSVVGPGPERWETIDPVAAARWQQAEWGGVAVELASAAPFLLAATEQSLGKDRPPYCGPLPQLGQSYWGVVTLHPWVLEQLRKPPAAAEPTGVTAAADRRLFRFIDMQVEPGKQYRYRTRLEVWNPNWKLPVQHLADAGLATAMKLPSPSSNETPAVTVPGSDRVLVDILRRADMKKMKAGWLEVLVLGPSELTGSYALRGLVTEAGGLVNVVKTLNQPGSDPRTRGEEIVTERVIIDTRGRQEDRTEQRSRLPPEPFELLCLRPDGGFDFVSTADSELVIAEYRATLPAAEASKRDGKQGQQDTAPSPFGSPF